MKVFYWTFLVFVLLCVGATSPQNHDEKEFVVTAYCRCAKCCDVDTGITASGKSVSSNGGKFVAADRRYKFGTMIFIPGYHTEAVPVYDRGGAIKGDKIDVYFNSHRDALKWGRQKLVCRVYH